MLRDFRARGALATGLVLAGCASSSYGTVGVNTGKHPVGATIGGPATGGSGGTTGGASSSSSSTGGAGSGTTGASCGTDWVAGWEDGGFLPAAGECPVNQVELKGRLIDICAFSGTSAPPITGNFTAADAFDPTLMAVTGSCGVYWFCVDAGTQLTPTFQLGSTYFPVELATLNLSSQAPPKDDDADNGMIVFCDALFGTGQVTGLQPALVPTQAFVVVDINELQSDAGSCDDKSGWTFALAGPDGGQLDAPSFVVAGTAITQTDAGTTGIGIQIFYNLDPALKAVTVSGDRPGNDLPDGGRVCPELSLDPSVAQFTGEVPLTASDLSYFLYVIP